MLLATTTAAIKHPKFEIPNSNFVAQKIHLIEVLLGLGKLRRVKVKVLAKTLRRVREVKSGSAVKIKSE